MEDYFHEKHYPFKKNERKGKNCNVMYKIVYYNVQEK